MVRVKACLNGAVSIVNAISNGKGATLGISLKTNSEIEVVKGSGISLESQDPYLSSKLVKKLIEESVSKKDLENNKLIIRLDSEIPTGYGLKSSSAISTAISLACSKIFKKKINDSQILKAGVEASIKAKVSLTGAYDDACGCYFGGFAVTDNYQRRLVKWEKIPKGLTSVIFIPKSRKRGNVKKLSILKPIFHHAWKLAKDSDYWNAMVINGLAVSPILNSDPKIITELLANGALGASVSGNGPSIAAIVKKENVNNVKKIFSNLEGKTIVSETNNKKAEVFEL